MGDEAYDQFDLPDVGKPRTKRTLSIAGGYSRDEVYIGICQNQESFPDDVIAVDGRELKAILRSMQIGRPRERRRVPRKNRRLANL